MSGIIEIEVFINRLKKIGIEIELVSNLPWVYINKINGKEVIEKFKAEHGFLFCYLPIKKGNKIEILNREEIFDLIRKYK